MIYIVGSYIPFILIVHYDMHGPHPTPKILSVSEKLPIKFQLEGKIKDRLPG